MTFADFLNGNEGGKKATEAPAGNESDPFKDANAVDTREVLEWLGVPLDGDRITQCPGCGADGKDGSVAIVRGGWKCQHSSCASKGHPRKPGFRTNIDTVVEERGVSAKAAVRLISEQFGTSPLRPRAQGQNGSTKTRVQGDIEFLTTQDGTNRVCVANVLTALQESELWRGVVVYDEFKETVVVTRQPPARPKDAPKARTDTTWTDIDDVTTCAWLSEKHDLHVPLYMIRPAVETLARTRRIHPVREYLRSLKWDGVDRLPTWLHTYLGADRNPYTEAIGVRFPISAVARVMKPGCKADCALILEGSQGIYKSTIAAALARTPEWFADSNLEIGNKDSYQNLRGVWIYELAELSSLKSAKDVERVKNFISSPSDRYRPSYGRAPVTYPRQTVFIGTTNESAYLVDRTGNRRFWPVRCGQIDIAGLRDVRDQLWAEALARFERGESWYVDSTELAALCSDEQEERVEEEPWDTFFIRWLEDPTVPTDDTSGTSVRVDLAGGLTTADVLTGALGVRRGDIARRQTMRTGDVLRRFGFERRLVRVKEDWKKREWRYFRTVDTEASLPVSDDAGLGRDVTSEPKRASVTTVTTVTTSNSLTYRDQGNNTPTDPDRSVIGDQGCANPVLRWRRGDVVTLEVPEAPEPTVGPDDGQEAEWTWKGSHVEA